MSPLFDQPLLPENWEFPEVAVSSFESLKSCVVKSYENKAIDLAEKIVQDIATIGGIEVLEEVC